MEWAQLTMRRMKDNVNDGRLFVEAYLKAEAETKENTVHAIAKALAHEQAEARKLQEESSLTHTARFDGVQSEIAELRAALAAMRSQTPSAASPPAPGAAPAAAPASAPAAAAPAAAATGPLETSHEAEMAALRSENEELRARIKEVERTSVAL